MDLEAYPWYEKGLRQKTKIMIERSSTISEIMSDRIRFRAICEDRHCSGKFLDYGDPVYLDSCVEWFFDPFGIGTYINIEVNCVGTIYMAYGDCDVDSRLLLDEAICTSLVKVETSLKKGVIKDVQTDDLVWTIEMFVDVQLLTELLLNVHKRWIHQRGYRMSAGQLKLKDRWTMNIYRCGGEIEPQYASAFPIDYPYPSFHRPEFFKAILME